MGTKRIPFNLITWLNDKSQKVVTRGGNSVRIICTNSRADQPIVALVTFTYEGGGTYESVETYNENGHYWAVGNKDADLDLFLVTEEPEMSEFEKVLADIVHSWGEPDVSPYNAPGVLKEDAANLLAIARKQIEAECVADDGKTLDEDERIRKELIAFLRYYYYGQGDSRPFNEDWIFWLEKLPKEE